MSKADELFDELGYEKIHDNKRRIVYKLCCFTKIEFNLKEQYVYCDCLDMQELKAINEKCKELQWI